MTQVRSTKKSFTGKIAVHLAKNISSDVLSSGNPENLILLAKKHVKFSIIAALIIYPLVAGLIISFQFELESFEKQQLELKDLQNQKRIEEIQQGLLITTNEESLSSISVFQPFVTYFVPVLLLIPPLVLLYPKISLKNQGTTRKNLVEEELPFFGIFASVMHSVNSNLYSCFLATIDKGIFRAIEKEAMLLKRNVDLFGQSPLEAIEELGRTHKSQIFKNFLLGYSSIARSGGDLSKYLETTSEEQFRQLKTKYVSYSKNVGYVVETLVILLIVAPILFVVSSFILPSESISQLMLAAGIGVPIMTIIFAVLLVNIQPKMFNLVGLSNIKILSLLPISFFVFFSLYFLEQETWFSLAIAAIIPSLIIEYYTLKHKIQINKIEKILPNFLREITEYRKIGISEVSAIMKISEEKNYNPTFNRLVKTLSSSFKQGYSFSEILSIITLRSWFARMTFFILSEISESGGGHPAVLESVTGFVQNVQAMLKEAKSSISVYDILAYLSPILLVFTISMINEMVGTIEIPQNTAMKGFDQLLQVSPVFLETIKTFAVSSSIGIGILMGKASDGTFKSTGRVAILCILAILSIFLVENTSILGIFGGT
ncbi:MAG: type II secretion system F family protein [Nitrosopumilus sp.]